MVENPGSGGLPLSITLHLVGMLGLASIGLLTIPKIDPPDRPIVYEEPPRPIAIIVGEGAPPIRKGSRSGEKNPAPQIQPPQSETERPPKAPVTADITPTPDQDPSSEVSGSGEGVPFGDPMGDPEGSPDGSSGGLPGGTGQSGSGTGSGPIGNSDEILDGRLHPPRIVRRIEPVYPPLAMAARMEGIVLLEVVIGADGRITEVRVLKSSPLLDRAAVEAIRQWVYEPAKVDGRPVAVYLKVEVSFRLK